MRQKTVIDKINNYLYLAATIIFEMKFIVAGAVPAWP